MSEMLFLSEYVNPDNRRSAWVCRERNTNGFVTVCYECDAVVDQQTFDLEHLAEHAAEDWVCPAKA